MFIIYNLIQGHAGIIDVVSGDYFCGATTLDLHCLSISVVNIDERVE
ncbi:hypothetical protein DSUL_60173 [Desulfovibrionales bacterium]